ncbi:MAG: STAS domain-containing protein [Actinomycetota bacterium]
MTEEPVERILTVDRIDGGLRIRGQVDLSNVDRFREALATATPNASVLVIDLSECSYMGSEGIGALIETVRSLGRGRLVLRSPSGIIHKVLDLSGLGKLANVEISA